MHQKMVDTPPPHPITFKSKSMGHKAHSKTLGHGAQNGWGRRDAREGELHGMDVGAWNTKDAWETACIPSGPRRRMPNAVTTIVQVSQPLPSPQHQLRELRAIVPQTSGQAPTLFRCACL
jgi:hypothetical protein